MWQLGKAPSQMQAVYVLYTNDSILAGPDKTELDKIVDNMKAVRLNLSVDGDVSDFFGVKINHESDGMIHLTQLQIIDSILQDLPLVSDNVKTWQTPAAVTTILCRHPNSDAFDEHFHYRSVIGKLNFLEKSTRPDISCAAHQCACIAANPKKEHGKAVEWLCRYLAATGDKGIILKPTTKQLFNVYVDADYVGIQRLHQMTLTWHSPWLATSSSMLDVRSFGNPNCKSDCTVNYWSRVYGSQRCSMRNNTAHGIT
jgi:hypothetical protein